MDSTAALEMEIARARPPPESLTEEVVLQRGAQLRLLPHRLPAVASGYSSLSCTSSNAECLSSSLLPGMWKPQNPDNGTGDRAAQRS